MIVVNFDPVDNNIFVLVDRTIEVNFGSASPDSGGNLKSDGSVEMDAGYEPTAVQQIATLKTVQDNAVGAGVAGVTGDGVDNTDPANPVMSFPAPGYIGAEAVGVAAALDAILAAAKEDVGVAAALDAILAAAKEDVGVAAALDAILAAAKEDVGVAAALDAILAAAKEDVGVAATLIAAHAAIANPHGTDFADLSDKDRAIQAATAKGNISGAVVFDMSKSVITCTLTGDVTGVSFSNNPGASDFVTAVINVFQDATGSRTIDWAGSGVHTGEGEAAGDFQPLVTASSLTKYWLFWEGTYWTITKREISVTAL